ncbi:MAG: hypothetical protein KDA68_08035, partial [Planctomycetaceae bacterium]|nr:hypothetical protein [Planctomycetaceae bacterium]
LHLASTPPRARLHITSTSPPAQVQHTSTPYACPEVPPQSIELANLAWLEAVFYRKIVNHDRSLQTTPDFGCLRHPDHERNTLISPENHGISQRSPKSPLGVDPPAGIARIRHLPRG